MPTPEDTQVQAGRVNLVDPDGSIVNADAADLDVLLSDGFRVAEPDEVARDFERQQYGEGIGNELQTFGESTLSGATLGLTDVAARALSPEYADELAKRREYNPTADVLGQGTGLIGATLLTGGESLLAKGAAAATAPARGLMAAGTAATEAAARALGKEATTSLLGRAAVTGASYAAGGAVEGALFGAAKVATEDYLNDNEITAERIAAGAGNGALWGGAAGGALGLTGGLVAGGANKLGALFERGSKGELTAAAKLDDVLHGEAAANAEARVAADLDQSTTVQAGFRSDDEILAELTTGAGDMERQGALAQLRAMGDEQAAAKQFDRLQQDATRELTAAGNRVAKAADDADAFTNVGLKKDVVRKLFQADSPADLKLTTDRVATTLGEIDDAFKTAAKQPEIFERKGLQAFAQAQKEIDTIASKLRAPRSADELADVYIGMDRLKRRLGRIQRSAGSGANGDRAAEALVRDGYDKLRNLLEDADAFGGAVTGAQRDINAAWTRYLEFSKAHESLFALRNQTTRSARDGFETIAEMDPAKVGGFLRGLGKAENEVNEKVWLLGAERRADLLETLARHYDVPDSLKAQIASARSDTQMMASRMRELRTLNETADAYREQLQSVRDLPVVGETLAKVKINLGKGVSLVTKSDARASARAAAQSGATVHEQQAIRHATAGERKIENAVRGVVEWVKAPANKVAKATRATADAIAKAGPLMGVDMALGKPETYERLVRNVTALRDPQSDERRVIRARATGLRRANPGLAEALEAHTQRTADFLAAKAGELYAVPRNGDPFGGKRKPRHDPAKSAKLALYVDAAQNPQHALDRIAQGDIKREDIETLKALYPRLYQRVVSEVLGRLGEVEELPPYQARLKLGHLLDAPADPSMRPDNVAWLQQVANSGAQEAAQAKENGTLAPSRRREPRLSGMYATRSQDLMGASK